MTWMFVVRGGLISPGGGVVEPCDRFAFFEMGSSAMVVVVEAGDN